ncbi:hypothetical protein H072_7881 [Dactylellina haptotyla CBS 200.50]|uniref:F-box domain-containing protein n=1 Tax=Dactylellina haptotyla (strain CBS 200.50) TaxID=1284197 RepID=S8BT60_DACHA|nr:hypothetical protein H072_7881 [Dactylellina haptotyla CBS 200.50]
MADSNPNPVTPVFPLPHELSEVVLTYVPTSDLKSFSLSSKLCRALSLRVLFRGIRLRSESYELFKDGGKLSHIREFVRYANLTVAHGIEEPFLIGLVREHTHFLTLFTRLTALKISFYTYRRLQWHVFPAIFKHLSSNSSNSFKYLILHCPESLASINISAAPTNRLLNALTGEDSKFINAGRTEYGDMTICPVTKKYTAFTPLAISRMRNEGYLPSAPTELTLTSDTIVLGAPVTFYHSFTEILLQSSQDSLQRLEIFAHSISSPVIDHYPVQRTNKTTPKILFNNVTYLRLELGGFQDCNLQEIVHRFPNVETLSVAVWSPDYNLRHKRPVYDISVAVYEEITLLRNLKSVTLPWPALDNTTMKLARWQLEKSVDWWLELAAASTDPSRLSQLTNVEFVTGTNGMQERYLKCPATAYQDGGEGIPRRRFVRWEEGRRPIGTGLRQQTSLEFRNQARLWQDYHSRYYDDNSDDEKGSDQSRLPLMSRVDDVGEWYDWHWHQIML